jgi:phosphate transport system protein
VSSGRLAFRDELARCEGLVRRLGEQVRLSLDDWLHAVRERDLARAEEVVERERAISGTQLEVARAVELLLALQAPVAADLRLVLAASHIALNLERIGAQAATASKLLLLTARLDTPRSLDGTLVEMGERTIEMVRAALDALHQRDPNRTELLDRLDDRLDLLNREVLRQVVMRDCGVAEREYGVLMVLMARALERAGDNAVAISQHAAYLVTGTPFDRS